MWSSSHEYCTAAAGRRTRTSARRSNSIAIPARTQGEAIQTLMGIAGGSLLGTGQTFRTDIEELRNDYKLQVDELNNEVAAKRAAGMSDAEIRPWADAERLRIARAIRLRQGPTASVVLEARDWLPPQADPRLRRFSGYGWGGERKRTWNAGRLPTRSFATLDRRSRHCLCLRRRRVASPCWASRLWQALGGGMLSGWGAHKLLFSNHPHAQSAVQQDGTLPAHMVQSLMPSPPAGQHR